MKNNIIFECSEIFPLSGAVIECERNFVRIFPDHAFNILFPIFDNVQFRFELVANICQLNTKIVIKMMTESRKTGFKRTECRNTAYLALVGDMFMVFGFFWGTL